MSYGMLLMYVIHIFYHFHHRCCFKFRMKKRYFDHDVWKKVMECIECDCAWQKEVEQYRCNQYSAVIFKSCPRTHTHIPSKSYNLKQIEIINSKWIQIAQILIITFDFECNRLLIICCCVLFLFQILNMTSIFKIWNCKSLRHPCWPVKIVYTIYQKRSSKLSSKTSSRTQKTTSNLLLLNVYF